MKQHQKVPFGIMGLFMAIGIVYGDIGTSPLYVMKAILNGLPAGQQSNPDYITGAISCIIWTLTLQTTIKYVLVTLRADNGGEGGILSLFALVRKKYRWAYFIAAIGAATLLADGIITPAITVVSAAEGLNNLLPSIPIIPFTIAILLLLFLIQPLGTAKLGKSFGVIMFLWFSMLGILGIFALVHYPLIFKAFNPIYAIMVLKSAPNAFIILGAVFLCTTGAEALYSDLGHCGLRNIRISWIFVKITLILNYLGQGAWIITHSTNIIHDINPFFSIMPQWFSFIGVIMATLAAIIASQALISGSFTIISEAISLDLWPNIQIKYPTEIKGQMYIPGVNHALMVLCIIMVLAFGSSSNMEAAYGLSITITMMMTTVLLFIYLHNIKRSLWVSIPLTMFFLSIEGSFFVANMFKFAHGGFATILIAGFLFSAMYVWYNGRRIKNRCVTYEPIAPTVARLDKISEDETIPKFATHLVYVTRAKYPNDMESKVIYSLLHKQPKRADTYWFVYLHRSDEPYHFRYSVKTYVKQKIFRIDIFSGFKQGVHIDTFVHLICKDLEENGKVNLTSRYPSLRDSGIEGDFRFVVVERIIRNLDLPPFKKTLLTLYYMIKRFSTSDTQILDLDPSLVTLEYVPLKNLRTIEKKD
ncbi:MAG: KUP/HAK/KT family potassium transporter [Paludibacter sp.]|nr:KUP/HAK/KT family potassium transporter [Paludibacter sp.]